MSNSNNFSCYFLKDWFVLDVLDIKKQILVVLLSSYTEEHEVLQCGGDRKLWNMFSGWQNLLFKNALLIKMVHWVDTV